MLVFFLFLLLAPTGLIIPVLWIMRTWLQERAISTLLGLTGIVCHLLIFAFLVSQKSFGLLVYCGIILLAIGLQPLLGPRADWRVRSQMIEEDIARYKRKLERFPENAALHSALAGVYMDCRRYDEAIEEYQIAIDLDPDRSRPEAWRLREAQAAKAKADLKLRKRRQPANETANAETEERSGNA